MILSLWRTKPTLLLKKNSIKSIQGLYFIRMGGPIEVHVGLKLKQLIGESKGFIT